MPLKRNFKIEEEQDEIIEPIEEQPIGGLFVQREGEILNRIPIREVELDEEILDRNHQRSLYIHRNLFEEKFTAEYKRLTSVKTIIELVDDAELIVTAGTSGWGFVMMGSSTLGYEEHAQFVWTKAGDVTLIANSTNAVNTNTDGKLCVYDAGTGIAIKNRLNSTKEVRYELNYR